MDNEINWDGLLRLANFIEALRPEQWDYSTLGETRSCGTVGCAIGWACLMPEAKEKGVEMKQSRWDIEFDSPCLTLFVDGSEASFSNAAHRLFGLSRNQAQHLFMPGEYDGASGLPDDATAAQVAAHIRNFVHENAPTL